MAMFPIPSDRIVVNDLMAVGADELAEHAAALAIEIREGRYENDGDLSLEVALGHLMDHLVDIWHVSKMDDGENERESHEDYCARCLEIPRLQDGYHFVDCGEL